MKGFLPDQTRIKQVHLRTGDVERSAGFYSEVLGLKAAKVDQAAGGPGREVLLSPGPKRPGLLLLSENPDATPRPPGSVGLYHFALRYPSRADLADVYRRIINAGYPISGASDHGVSEAIYLEDLDGNGVELYADRPRSEWRWRNGQIEMVTRPLDLNDLLATSPEPARLDPHPRRTLKQAALNRASPSSSLREGQPDLGHIHLNVASLEAAEKFYSEFLGFSVTTRAYPGALFFAAGGYHHHVGVNTWAGTAAPPANSSGLVSYRIEVPVSEILYCLQNRAPLLGYEVRTENQSGDHLILKIRDPNGTWLEIEAAKNTVSAGVKCSVSAA